MKTNIIFFLAVFFTIIFFAQTNCKLQFSNERKFEYLNAKSIISNESINFTENDNRNWYVPEAEVYYIDTYSKLKDISLLVSEGVTFKNKEIILLNDIDKRTDFTIGNKEKSFEGKFDGKNNFIKTSKPLFYTIKNAEIKNLNLDVSIVSCEIEDIGILACKAYNSKIYRVAVSLVFGNNGNQGNFGGILAYAKNTQIIECAVTGNIIRQGAIILGGLVAVSEESYIIDSYSSASITVLYIDEFIVGGICGSAIGSSIVSCVNYLPIILKPFLNFEYEVNRYVGTIAGEINESSKILDAHCLKSYLTDGINGVGKYAKTSEIIYFDYEDGDFKEDYFRNVVLNQNNILYVKDPAGYEVNKGYPIFTYQVPRPRVNIEIAGLGFLFVNGNIMEKSFNCQFREILHIEIIPDKYYTVEEVIINGQKMEVLDQYFTEFYTEELLTKFDLKIVFSKEMRKIELTGIKTWKIYDGGVSVSLENIEYEEGLKIKNKYFEEDEIFIENSFTSLNPIKMHFKYQNVDAIGQCLILENVKFKGESVSNYVIPDKFEIYDAKILKKDIDLYFGEIDSETQEYKKNEIVSVYGESILEKKYFCFAINENNFMFFGELFIEILKNEQFSRLDENEKLPVGEYIVRPNGLQSKNYNFIFVECIMRIIPRKLFVSFNVKNDSIIYGENPEFKFSYKNFAKGDDESVVLSLPYYTEKVLVYGIHKIKLVGGNAQNYEIVNEVGTIKVEKRQINMEPQKDVFKIYGEQDVVWLGVSNGLVNEDYIVLSRQPGEFVGEYNYISYNIKNLSDEDISLCYEVEEINKNIKFAIKKRNISIIAEDVISIYGKMPNIKFKFENIVQGDSISPLSVSLYEKKEMLGGEIPINKINAGEYYIVPNYKENHENYIIECKRGVLTVLKADLNFILKDARFLYGEKIRIEFDITGFKNNEDIFTSEIKLENLRYYIDMKDTTIYLTSDLRLNFGAYKINATGCEARNYNFLYKQADLFIDKADLLIKIINGVVVVYGEEINFQFEYLGLLEGDVVEEQIEGLHVEYEYVTEIQTVYSVAYSNNYKISYEGNTLKLNKRSVSVQGIYIKEKLYDKKNDATVFGNPRLEGVLPKDNIQLKGDITAKFSSVEPGNNILVEVSGLYILGEFSHMYELVIGEFYANISINKVSFDGIEVITENLLPFDISLVVNEINGVQKNVKKAMKLRKVYYKVKLTLQSTKNFQNERFYIYLSAPEIDNTSNLRAIVFENGKYVEKRVTKEGDYLVIECQELGELYIVRNNNLLLVLLLVFSTISVLGIMIKLYMLNRKRKKEVSNEKGKKIEKDLLDDETFKLEEIKVEEGKDFLPEVDDEIYEALIKECTDNNIEEKD